MRTVRLHGVADLRIADEPRPTPGPDESLVRVTAVGLCGSDLHWYAEGGIGSKRLDRPLVVGHEFAGVVEGGELDGRAVAVDPAVPCERCPSCLRGYRNLCPTVGFAGEGERDGALQEYLAWPTELLVPLPDALSAADGAMLEPLGVAIHAIDLGHVHLGDRVAVVGCGPVGLLVLQVARLAGATSVVAVERLPHRREMAGRLGADQVLSPEDDVEVDADVVFEVAGPTDAVALSVRAARPGGRVVLAGIPSDDTTSFNASIARRKGLTLAVARRMNDVYPRAVELVEKKLVDIATVVTHEYPLADVVEAFRVADAREGGKVVVNADA